MTGVVPEELRPALLKKLEVNILEKNKGHLDTGMLGTYFMMEYLRDIGRNDLVSTIMSQTTYPGWGYMLENGATTCWEQWNGYASHIHSCFTSPDNWFYQGLAGILPDAAAPGFRKFLIKPWVPAMSPIEKSGDLTWVKAHYDSSYGRIVSSWKLDGGRLMMEVTVPPNTTATVYVPASNVDKVTESDKPAGKAAGVRFLRMEKGSAVYEVGSGRYQFCSDTGL
jgi:alpha-L-rhamnosidase